MAAVFLSVDHTYELGSVPSAFLPHISAQQLGKGGVNPNPTSQTRKPGPRAMN